MRVLEGFFFVCGWVLLRTRRPGMCFKMYCPLDLKDSEMSSSKGAES